MPPPPHGYEWAFVVRATCEGTADVRFDGAAKLTTGTLTCGTPWRIFAATGDYTDRWQPGLYRVAVTQGDYTASTCAELVRTDWGEGVRPCPAGKPAAAGVLPSTWGAVKEAVR